MRSTKLLVQTVVSTYWKVVK